MIKATLPMTEMRRAAPLLLAAAAKRPKIPILLYALVDVSADRVDFSVTDLDHQITISVDAETHGIGRFMVNTRSLADFVAVSSGDITITLDGESIGLSDGSVSATMRSHISAADYPEMKPDGSLAEVTWSMPPDQAVRLFRLCRPCVSTETTRYYLNGVFLTVNPTTGNLRSVATDGRRMAIIDTDVEEVDGIEAIVPTSAVDLFLKAFGKTWTHPIQFAIGGPWITVKSAGYRLISKMIDGKYPDYAKGLKGAGGGMQALLSAPQLRRLVRISGAPRLSDWWRPTQAAVIDFKNQKITASKEQDDISATLDIQASRCGSGHDRAAFSLRYLEGLASLSSSITLRIGDNRNPATIVGDDPHAVWVLMPMRMP